MWDNDKYELTLCFKSVHKNENIFCKHVLGTNKRLLDQEYIF